MGMVTQSIVRDRAYQRAFDHDLARKLRAEGKTYSELADQFGVSISAIERVCKPAARKRMDKASLEWIRENKREPCRGGCGRLVWLHDKGRSGFCPTCLGVLRAAPNVRENELRCTKCGLWKPDDEFGREKRPTRRGRRTWCRECDTAARANHRRAHREEDRRASRNSKRKGKLMTTFRVLRQNGDGWEELDPVEASSRLHAIEKAADGEGTLRSA